MLIEIVRTKSGLRIGKSLGLSLIRKSCPDLHWEPKDDLSAAEEAYFKLYGVYPNYFVLQTRIYESKL